MGCGNREQGNLVAGEPHVIGCNCIGSKSEPIMAKTSFRQLQVLVLMLTERVEGRITKKPPHVILLYTVSCTPTHVRFADQSAVEESPAFHHRLDVLNSDILSND